MLIQNLIFNIYNRELKVKLNFRHQQCTARLFSIPTQRKTELIFLNLKNREKASKPFTLLPFVANHMLWLIQMCHLVIHETITIGLRTTVICYYHDRSIGILYAYCFICPCVSYYWTIKPSIGISELNPTKLFFFGNEEFFRFLLVSLAVVQSTHFFHMLQALELNSKNRKTKKMKVW